jgi:hypothetical protein
MMGETVPREDLKNGLLLGTWRSGVSFYLKRYSEGYRDV